MKKVDGIANDFFLYRTLIYFATFNNYQFNNSIITILWYVMLLLRFNSESLCFLWYEARILSSLLKNQQEESISLYKWYSDYRLLFSSSKKPLHFSKVV